MIKLPIENCATRVFSWIKAVIDIFMPDEATYFTPACSTPIAHRNNFFRLDQCDSFDHTSLCTLDYEGIQRGVCCDQNCKRVLNEALFADRMKYNI